MPSKKEKNGIKNLNCKKFPFSPRVASILTFTRGLDCIYFVKWELSTIFIVFDWDCGKRLLYSSRLLCIANLFAI